MIIKAHLMDCTIITKGLKDGSFRAVVKLLEHRNKYNAPEFDIDGVRYYVERMSVEYETHVNHHVCAVILKEVDGGKSIERFNLDIDYPTGTMRLEEI